MKPTAVNESLLEGFVSLERRNGYVHPWRLPVDQLRLFPPEEGIVERASTPAGVRLRFRTDSRAIALEVEPTDEPQRLFDLTIEGDLAATVPLPAGDRRSRS